MIKTPVWFDVVIQGSSLIVEPTIAGLQWLLQRHWNLATYNDLCRSAFDSVLRTFLLMEHIECLTKEDKICWGFLTDSLIIALNGKFYLVAGNVSGLSAMQCLSRDWFLECQEIEKDKNE